jgi:succinate dehydrogenase/fumarate reductase flavoprotein subunit
MTATQNSPKRKFDVVIVGAGGSGMCAFQLARCWPDRRRCPVFPDTLAHGRCTRGIGASGQHVGRQLAPPLYDTVKGLDWLGDQDAIEYTCCEGAQGRIRSYVTHALLTVTQTARFTNGPSAATQPTTVRNLFSAVLRQTTGHADAAHAKKFSKRQGKNRVFLWNGWRWI